MPWDKSEKNEIFFSVGRLEMYIIKDHAKFKFQLAFGLPFGSQAICCVFDSANDFFGIGCDDGSVHYYVLDRKKKPFHRPLFEMKIHKKRIMGVAIDSAKKIGYSIALIVSCNSCSNPRKPKGKRRFSRRTRAPASSSTSIALSGKNRSAIYLSDKIAACSRALS